MGVTWAVCLIGWLGIALVPNQFQAVAMIYVDTDTMMAPLLKGAPPEIVRHTAGETLELAVSLDLSWLTKAFSVRGLRLGLAAVIEDKAQVLSYWALKHPAEKPDFHHAGSFVVELD